MSVPPSQAPRAWGDPAEREPEASLFARIENLINEEHALLLIPATERGRRDHERLREIEDQLDRIWEKLRERSRRLRHDAGRDDRRRLDQPVVAVHGLLVRPGDDRPAVRSLVDLASTWTRVGRPGAA